MCRRRVRQLQQLQQQQQLDERCPRHMPAAATATTPAATAIQARQQQQHELTAAATTMGTRQLPVTCKKSIHCTMRRQVRKEEAPDSRAGWAEKGVVMGSQKEVGGVAGGSAESVG